MTFLTSSFFVSLPFCPFIFIISLNSKVYFSFSFLQEGNLRKKSLKRLVEFSPTQYFGPNVEDL